MAQIEIPTPYQNTAVFEENGSRHNTCTLAPLYYETVRGSGNFDALLDMTPTMNAGVQEFGKSQFRLLNTLGMGLLSFQGRKDNAQALQMQLVDVGFLRANNQWASGNIIANVLTSANWSRSSNTSYKIGLGYRGQGGECNVENITTWTDVWPGIDVTVRNEGNKVKPDFTLSPAARLRMSLLLPTLWNSRTTLIGGKYYLGNSIPKFAISGAQKNADSGFDVPENARLEMFAGDGAALGFMSQIDMAYAGVNGKLPRQRDYPQEILLQKRIYKDTDGYYLVVGMYFDQFMAAKAGAITFDPSVQVATGNADGDMQFCQDDSGRSATNGSTITLTGNFLRCGSHGSNNEWSTACYFAALAAVGTVTAASMTYYSSDTFTSSNTVRWLISPQLTASPSALSTSSGDFLPSGRPRTSSFGTLDVTALTLNQPYTQDITTAMGEVLALGGWASGNPVVILADTDPICVSGEYQEMWSYNGSAGNAPVLNVTVSSGGRVWPIMTPKTYFFIDRMR